jgi:hypothetical protein
VVRLKLPKKVIDPNNGEQYTGNMDIAIEFNSSGFKHGISKERCCFNRLIMLL